ncbi:extracellular sulfatase Sulf-1-like [Ruditapes philippinarum]|uniref:extracellular sulfatase Sulf-1-like n=1 Tax=Ruditapes philippinarum TaxID=129788 RepID=UPI00295BD45C|nr:extracellular sulfatase Sulf-1-like [Ruditapes philippinarum]
MASTMLTYRMTIFGLCFIFYMTLTLVSTRTYNGRYYDDSSRNTYNSDRRQYYGPMREDKNRRSHSEKPNIILIITDDQDELLGSVTTMTKMLKIMGNEGVRFNNSFVSTPMCCPSRSTLLTGLYPHNHHVYTNNDNCSGIEWQKVHEPRTFAKYLSDAGYRTGYFGKYLNEYNGTYIPPGWREWVGLCKNSQFYNYTLNFNGQKVKHDDNYYRDYFPDLITNDSITFLKQSKQYFPTKPVMMMLSVPAPHGPEDAAPQYQHMFENNTLHRTPSWNYMNNSDKQWLLQRMKPMEPIDATFTDMLQRKRLQTLQSVDSLVEKVHYELRLLGELDNTYIIYTSDHGYHLGQYGIVKGKALPYDFDTRVPLFMRGPGILKDTKIPNIVGNVDIAPTILDMAGIEIPAHMDGRSLLKLIKVHKVSLNLQGDFVETKRPWRDTFLIERGKVTKNLIKAYTREQDRKILEDHEDELMQYANPKLRRTLKICKDPNNQPPCKMNQKWVCFRDSRNRKRTKKCRNYNKTVAFDDQNQFQKDSPARTYNLPASTQKNPKCDCSKQWENNRPMTEAEETMQRNFLRNHVNDKDFEPRFLRNKRSYNEDLEWKMRLIAQQLENNRQRCRFYPNNTFACDRDLERDPEKWDNHKLQLDEMIEETKKRLRNLKKIRKNMKKQRKKLRRNKYDDDGNDYERNYNIDYTTEDDYDDEDSEDYDDDVSNYSNDECNCDENYELPPELTGYEDVEDDSSEVDFDLTLKKGRNCNHDDLKCTMHHNNHWKTPPYWTLGPFCFCTNAVTNTYWCLRTINTTHDFLYCEFIDNFLSYYDFKTDPYQLENKATSLDYGIMNQLHEELTELRRCEGWKQCSVNKNYNETNKKRRRRRRKVKPHRRARRKRLTG